MPFPTLNHLPLANCLRRLTARLSCSRRTALLFGGIALLMVFETALFVALAPPQPVHTARAASMTPKEALQYIEAHENVLIVDLRTRKEFSGARLPGAVNIPMHSLFEGMGEIPADRPVLLHCMYGIRSLQAYKLLRLHRPDITNIHYVSGQIITVPTY